LPAALLEIAPRSSLLVNSRTLLTVQGKPVKTGLSLYRADRNRAVLHIPATSISCDMSAQRFHERLDLP
jgi:hypothetical protein